MRVRSLVLEKYGAFEGRAIELGTGLSLVLGSNEAGKSTMLDALADLLWSIPPNSRRDFLFSRQALAVRAVLELPDREPFEVERVARGLTAVATGAAEIAVWQGEGDDWSRWLTSFGLSHDKLRQGGRDLCQAKGDLAGLIFEARSGQDVHRVLADLSERVDGLYKANRNAKGVKTRSAMAEYERVAARAEHEMALAFDVIAVRDLVERAENEVRRVREEAERAASNHDVQAAKLRVVGDVRALDVLRKRVAEVEAEGPCLTGDDLTTWAHANDELTLADGRVAELTRDVDEVSRSLADLVVDHDILDDQQLIADLERQHSARTQDAENAAANEAEADRVDGKARALLGELVGPSDGRSVDVLLDALWVGEDRAVELDAAASALVTAEALVATCAADRESAEAHSSSGDGDPAAPEEQTVAAVREVLQALHADGSAVLAFRQAAEAETKAVRERAERLAEAGLPVGTAVGGIASAESVKAAQDDLEHRAALLSTARADLASVEQRMTEVRERLAGLDARDVPDPRAVTTTRAERDAAIDDVVRAWLTGMPSSDAPDLPVRVERVVREADRVADLVAEHRTAAVERDLLAVQLDGAEADATTASAAVGTAESALAEARRNWDALWSSAGVAAPAPRDGVRFHESLLAVRAAEKDADIARRAREGLRAAVDVQRAYLAEVLRRAGRPRDDADLDSLVEAARTLLVEDDGAREARAVAAELRKLTEAAERRLVLARQGLDTAAEDWRRVAVAAGVGDLGPDAWNRRRGVLDRARAAHDDAEELRTSARDLGERYRKYADALADVAGRHGIDGDVMSTVDELGARLAAATTARTTSDAQVERRDSLEAKAAAAAAERLSALARLGVLQAQVGATDLRRAAERGTELADLGQRIDRHTGLVTAALPNADIAGLVAELADADDDVLRLDVDMARELRVKTRTEHEAAVVALGELRQRNEELVGRPGAADLHAQAQERLAELADDVEDYLVAVIQQTVLRDELEAYERKHASPLLDRAGHLLEELTGGRYVALRTNNHGSGRSLSIVGADEQSHRSDQLSEGTADQAFLALRLAGIESLQRERVARGLPTLPVVFDDVLMTFDDSRSAAALKVMSVLARDWQIIVLSHHDHIRQVAEGLGVDNLAVSTLSPPDPPRSARSPEEVRDAVREGSVLDGRTTPNPVRATRTTDPTTVRTWARENGMQVADRGRISADITDAYEAAHR